MTSTRQIKRSKLSTLHNAWRPKMSAKSNSRYKALSSHQIRISSSKRTVEPRSLTAPFYSACSERVWWTRVLICLAVNTSCFELCAILVQLIRKEPGESDIDQHSTSRSELPVLQTAVLCLFVKSRPPLTPFNKISRNHTSQQPSSNDLSCAAWHEPSDNLKK